MKNLPVVRCWKMRVAVGAERVMDCRILDAIVNGAWYAMYWFSVIENLTMF